MFFFVLSIFLYLALVIFPILLAILSRTKLWLIGHHWHKTGHIITLYHFKNQKNQINIKYRLKDPSTIFDNWANLSTQKHNMLAMNRGTWNNDEFFVYTLKLIFMDNSHEMFYINVIYNNKMFLWNLVNLLNLPSLAWHPGSCWF